VLTEVLASALRGLFREAWVEPETSRSAANLLANRVRAAGATIVGHRPETWLLLAEYARTLRLSHRAVPDALLVASAAVVGVTPVSFDRGLDRYPDARVRVLHPRLQAHKSRPRRPAGGASLPESCPAVSAKGTGGVRGASDRG
jgi:predicted nucleic acid-binding protein